MSAKTSSPGREARDAVADRAHDTRHVAPGRVGQLDAGPLAVLVVRDVDGVDAGGMHLDEQLAGPISGTGTCSSRSTSGPPNSRTTIACMVSP